MCLIGVGIRRVDDTCARLPGRSTTSLSDPELVESNPGKHESCPIPPYFPELCESGIVPGLDTAFWLRDCPQTSRLAGSMNALTVSARAASETI